MEWLASFNITSYFTQTRDYIEDFFEKYNIQTRDIIRFTSFFGIGFMLGLVCKRILKFVIMGLVVLIIVFATLSYFEIISLNYIKVQSLFGMEQVNSIQDFANYMIKLVALYWIELSCGSAGLLIGYKAG